MSEFSNDEGYKIKTKIQLFSCILAMNVCTLKLKIQYHLQSLKKKRKEYLGVNIISCSKSFQSTLPGGQEQYIFVSLSNETKILSQCPAPRRQAIFVATAHTLFCLRQTFFPFMLLVGASSTKKFPLSFLPWQVMIAKKNQGSCFCSHSKTQLYSYITHSMDWKWPLQAPLYHAEGNWAPSTSA